MSKNTTCIVVASCVLAFAAGIAPTRTHRSDEVQVDIHFDNSSVTTLLYDSGEAISLAPLNTWDHVNIWCPNGGQSTYSVGAITFTGTSLSTPLNVILGSASWTGTDSTKTTACQDFGGITCQNSSIEQYVHFEGKAGNDLTGLVRVGNVYRFDVGGTVSAGIVSTNSNASAFFACEVGDISSSGNVVAASGSIERVQTTGDCLGPIEAENGSITDVLIGGHLRDNVLAGVQIVNIDVSGVIDSGTSTLLQISANDKIRLIKATRVEADIDVTGTTTLTGWLGGIECTSSHLDGTVNAQRILKFDTPHAGKISVAGDMMAALTFRSNIQREIEVSGDLTGSITSEHTLVMATGSSPNETGSIFIDGDITATGSISLASNISGFAAMRNARIEVGGDVASGATITLGRPIDNLSVIEIGGSLIGSISIGSDTTAPGPMDGQVIINSSNSSDTWSGSVTAVSTTLAPVPLYTNTNASLGTGDGGGAVGEVPYSCHFGECTPAGTHYGSSGVATATASSTNSVTLWHYGLVEWSGFPYVVSRCSIAEDCIPGLGVVTGFSASGSGTRSVTVSENGHNFEAGYHYHFEPVLSGSNALKCSGINATNVPVRDYTFTVFFN